MKENVPQILPQSSMLLVMDFQKAILNRISQFEDLVERANFVISVAREALISVGYIHVSFTDEDYALIPASNKSFGALSSIKAMQIEDPESRIHEFIQPHEGDLVFRKTRVGAFSTTNLLSALREKNVDTLILAGISTSGVVLSTIREAADLDFRIYVLRDCCADQDEEVHQVLLDKVFPRQAYLIDSVDFHSIISSQ